MAQLFPADIETKLALDYPGESLHAVSRSLATYDKDDRKVHDFNEPFAQY